MDSIGSFILIKNEAKWIGPHLASWLPHLDQMVFLDGNSTDGTLEIIRAFKSPKIRLVEDRDPQNLREDYVRLFNMALALVDTDYAFFLHPDMVCIEPGKIRNLSGHLAYSTRMESFAGEGDSLYRIKGRGEVWKNIFRRRNPDLGLHYFGFYGAHNEDCYFRDITGDTHDFFGEDIKYYPYEVADSGIRIAHYSDVRSYDRRLGRMKACLANQGKPADEIDSIARAHARVTLKDGNGLTFEPAQYPPIFSNWTPC